jgi:hypothetical protein
MLLAWRSLRLRDLCQSEQALQSRWPASSSTAQELLGAVAHADRLGDLMRLRSMDLKVSDEDGRAAAVIRLGEVSMHAHVLRTSGDRVATPVASRPSDHLDSANALLVGELVVKGRAALAARRR